MQEYEIKMLELEDGMRPFQEWYGSLKDTTARARIRARLDRLSHGNPGDFRNLGSISELKLDFGPGYRIYYAISGKTIVVLLGGGDKSAQQRDIEKAQERWEKYKDAPDRFQGDFSG
jgi:putative addiction module killer protein